MRPHRDLSEFNAIRETLKVKLEDSIDKSGDCWIWMKGKNQKGYGLFRIAQRVIASAHRVSYWIDTGIDPGSLLVCHFCDIPSCVNPHHLFLGTHADNIRDAVSKGRMANNSGFGEDHGRSKLTQANVDEIRKLFASGFSKKKLARSFNVSPTCIAKIVNNVTWQMSHY